MRRSLEGECEEIIRGRCDVALEVGVRSLEGLVWGGH